MNGDLSRENKLNESRNPDNKIYNIPYSIPYRMFRQHCRNIGVFHQHCSNIGIFRAVWERARFLVRRGWLNVYIGYTLSRGTNSDRQSPQKLCDSYDTAHTPIRSHRLQQWRIPCQADNPGSGVYPSLLDCFVTQWSAKNDEGRMREGQTRIGGEC